MWSLYENGATDLEVCRELRINFREFERRIQTDPVFHEVVETGRAYAKAWFLSQGRVNLQNKNFSYSGWFMQMKNRYGWSDKVDQTVSEKPLDQLSTEELEERMLKHKAGIARLVAIKNVNIEDEDGSGDARETG